MNWKEQLNTLEANEWESSDWKAIIDLLLSVGEISTKEVEYYTRFNFAFVMLLVEVDYESLGYEEEYLATLLERSFVEANSRFANDPEYLFFTGITAYIAEWYFGMETVEPADRMLEAASALEPDNLLFKWASFLWAEQNPEHSREEKLLRANEIVSLQPSKLKWLRSKGMLGDYVLGILETFLYRDPEIVKMGPVPG